MVNNPPFKISNGTLEALKWLALLFMTIDHANRFFFKGSIYAAYCAGRLAMPLFAFILAYNLARPGTLERGIYVQTLKRLTVFGFLAMPAYNAMKGIHYWWPLNIMFTLWIATACLFLVEKGGIANIFIAIFFFFFGGTLVEYHWPGLAFCISAWFFCKKPSIFTLSLSFLCCLWLNNINNNIWALLTFPLIFIAIKIDLEVPRIRYLFYIYYPAHLSIFWLLSK